MSKQKTNKTMLKRLKMTSTGKVLKRHQLAAGHLKTKKSKKALRRQSKTTTLAPGDLKAVRKGLGI